MTTTLTVKLALAQQATSAFPHLTPIMNALSSCKNSTDQDPDNVIKNCMMQMSKPQLLKLQEGLNSSNNQTTRLNQIQRFIFGDSHNMLNSEKNAVSVLEDAMAAMTELSFTTSYLNSGGMMDWKLFNKHIMTAICRDQAAMAEE